MNRLSMFFCSAMLFIAMLWVYIYYMFPLFEYSGFKLNVSYSEMILSILILMFCTFFIRDDFKSDYYFIILTLSVIPSMVLYAVGGASFNFLFLTVYAYLLVVFFSKFKVPFINLFSLNLDFIVKFFTIVSAMFILGIISQGGMRYINFDIFSVYDFRDNASDNLYGFYGYLSPIFGKVIIPILIALSLLTKRYFYFAVGCIFSILVFSLTSHKSPLIYPVIIVFVYYIYNRRINFKVLFIISLILGVIYSSYDFYKMASEDEGVFGSFFFRRSLILPAYLNYLYVDFFSINEYYYWSNSKFSFGLVSSNYQYSAAYQIGSVYFDNSEAGANTGLVGSGYANFGIVGVTIYSLLTGLLISYFYAASKYIGSKKVFSYSFILFVTIILSTDLTTALLTHGLLGLLVILSIHPLENKSDFNK